MMKRALKISLLKGSCYLSLLLTVSTVMAAEKKSLTELPEVYLQEMIVTANRYEKRDIDIAASTQIYTRDDLEKTGTTNVISALSNMLGFTFMGYGPEGSSLGSKNSSLMIRGVDKGTLVLINGTPINLNGRYHLEDMPFDGIKKIEVIRGGGSVLYGSEAIGGVINIITSNNLKNAVSIASGSKGRQQYNVSTQVNKLSIAASYKHWGGDTITSDLITSAKKMNNYMRDMYRDSVYINYKFNQDNDLTIQHTESKKDFDYIFGEGYKNIGDVRYNRIYHYKKNFIQYNHHEDSWKGSIFFNDTTAENDSRDYLSSSGSKKGYPKYSYEKNRDYSYGFDIMKNWKLSSGNTSLGFNYQKENYNPDTNSDVDFHKNTYSVYAQWDKWLDSKNNLVLSGRETWAKMKEKSFSDFSGQIQYLYKLKDNASIYASVGQSFRMPYLREMYSNGVGHLKGNSKLKPEKGLHYELGWKKDSGRHHWQIALFDYYIKDNITYTLGRGGGQSYSTNEDTKNAGIEASMNYHGVNGFNYQIGVSYGNPKVKTRADNAPKNVTVKDYWDRQFGRIQVTGGLGYEKEKWSTNLHAAYTYQRVASPTSSPSFEIRPYLLTSLNVKYSPDKNKDIIFSMENLLNRRDNFGGSTTAYYSTPRCFLLKYNYNF